MNWGIRFLVVLVVAGCGDAAPSGLFGSVNSEPPVGAAGASGAGAGGDTVAGSGGALRRVRATGGAMAAAGAANGAGGATATVDAGGASGVAPDSGGAVSAGGASTLGAGGSPAGAGGDDAAGGEAASGGAASGGSPGAGGMPSGGAPTTYCVPPCGSGQLCVQQAGQLRMVCVDSGSTSLDCSWQEQIGQTVWVKPPTGCCNGQPDGCDSPYWNCHAMRDTANKVWCGGCAATDGRGDWKCGPLHGV